MKYYIIVASKDHVKIGMEQGFAQAGHGKKHQLNKLQKGDWIIYYSSKETHGSQKPYQKFTAIGQVIDEIPFQVRVNEDFKPWRRAIEFQTSNEVEIRPLVGHFNFITNRKRWGLHLMSGFLEIQQEDFDRIAEKMLVQRS